MKSNERAQDLRTASRPRTVDGGFSLLELVIGLAIILVVSSVAIPAIDRTLKVYRLNSGTSQVADQIQAARFEAIRRNLATSCLTQRIAANTYRIWTDTNNDGLFQATEKSIQVTGNPSLVDGGAIPTAGALAGTVGVAAMTTLSGSGGITAIAFDPRGATVAAGVNVFYVENPGRPQDGYRAIVILPSGSVQIWSGSNGGAWVRMN